MAVVEIFSHGHRILPRNGKHRRRKEVVLLAEPSDNDQAFPVLWSAVPRGVQIADRKTVPSATEDIACLLPRRGLQRWHYILHDEPLRTHSSHDRRESRRKLGPVTFLPTAGYAEIGARRASDDHVWSDVEDLGNDGYDIVEIMDDSM
jgi:hypothetical protein